MVSNYRGGLSRYEISGHAKQEMISRQISADEVHAVVTNPGQVAAVSDTRVILQSMIEVVGRKYVLRVFADIDRDPPVIVTVYRTSKIGKYWREDP